MKFNDLSFVVDRAGNALGKPEIQAFLYKFEYVPPAVAATVWRNGSICPAMWTAVCNKLLNAVPMGPGT